MYLHEYGVSGLPVVDAGGRLLGVISESDVVRAGAAPPPRSQQSVADVMSAPALATRPDAPLTEAARMMVEHDVTRLPVLRGDRLVGIVSRSDVVGALAVSDEELEAAVRGILARLPLGRSDVSFAVSGGRVRLRGELDTRLAEFLAGKIARLPGVRAVLPEVTWQTDERMPAAARSEEV